MKNSEKILNQIEELKRQLAIEIKNEKPHWVVVVDDSNCTVGVGGEGYMWEVVQSPRNLDWYDAAEEHRWYSYTKSIFRDATEEEIKNWKESKTLAKVTPHGKPRLCEDVLGKLDEMFDALLKK